MPSATLAPTLPRRSTSPNEALLSLEQAAQFLDVPSEFVLELTHIRQLPSRLVNGERRVRFADLAAYKRDFEQLLKKEGDRPLSEIWELPIFHETFFLREIPETR